MGSPLLIGIGAGLVSGVLFASAATGSLLAMALFYLAPLPSFLAGLGWGWTAAVLAALAGTLVGGAALGLAAGVSYLLTLGLPIALLCYLALLTRVAAAPASAPVGSGALEWYPPGRLVAWATLIAGSLAAGSVPLLGTDVESYRAAIHEVVEGNFLRRMGPSAQEFDKASLEGLLDVLTRVLPAASAMVWLGVAVFNMWAAGRIVDYSGRALRPWPDISRLTYPSPMTLGFVGSLILTFVPGMVGIVATGFAGAFMLAFTFLGLVIMHVITRNMPLRGVLLTGLYLSILLFGWVALFLAILGVGEPLFKLRQRSLDKDNSPGAGG